MSSGAGPARKATPRGQMTRGNNSGPAVMLMPPEIRSTFMPNPPLEPVPPVTYRRKQQWTAVSDVLTQLLAIKSKPSSNEKDGALAKTVAGQSISEQRKQQKMEQHQRDLQPLIAAYRDDQRTRKGEFKGMNCYNTLFVGRLAYEVTERKLLREMEAFGPVKDIRIVKREDDQSRGYAFVEYEHEEDMKRAYRAADGMNIDGREVVVDVERGHTVPDWLPRRLGGGLGGTRLGGRLINVTRPGRFVPHRAEPQNAPPISSGSNHGGSTMMTIAPMGGIGRGSSAGPPPPYGGGGGSGPPDRYGGGGGYLPQPPGRDWGDRGRGGGGDNRGGDGRRDYDDRHKRRRSRSPPSDQRYGGGSARRGRY